MKKMTLFAALCCAALMGCSKDWVNYSPMDMNGATLGYDDANAPKRLRAAAVAIQPSATNKSETLDTIRALVERIKSEHNDIQVIVFGELILEWYYQADTPVAYQHHMAEIIPSATTDFIKTLAMTHQVHIAVGLTELDTPSNQLYNTQILLRPTGELIKYRKRNLNETDLDNNIQAGNTSQIVDIDGIKCAMFICSDMQSDAVTHELANQEIDVVLQSLTTTTDLHTQVSYVGNQLNKWIVFANRYGKEGDFDYTGFTHIINPVGTISERAVGKNVYVYRNMGIY